MSCTVQYGPLSTIRSIGEQVKQDSFESILKGKAYNQVDSNHGGLLPINRCPQKHNDVHPVDESHQNVRF